MMNIKKYWLLICLWLLPSISTIFQPFIQQHPPVEDYIDQSIIGIQNMAFFNDLPGTFYVYFGRATCPDCVEFEPYLEDVLNKNGWTVYYFDTAYWKDSPRYDFILDKYHVQFVPSLVKIEYGEFISIYTYESDQSFDSSSLESFFIPHREGVFSVTSKKGDFGMPNYPIAFHDKLLCFTFIAMLINVVHLWMRKKQLPKSSLIAIIGNSTIIIALHIMIVGLGTSYAIHFNASSDNSFLAIIGRATWLNVTPILYFLQFIIVAITHDKVENT